MQIILFIFVTFTSCAFGVLLGSINSIHGITAFGSANEDCRLQRAFRVPHRSSISGFPAALLIRGGEEGSTKVKHVVDAAEFDRMVADAGNNLVVVDFSATWCGPCKMIAPAYDEISLEYGDVVFLKVDVDEIPEIAEKYQVMAMPTFLFMKNGEVADRFSGASIDKLRSTIGKHA